MVRVLLGVNWWDGRVDKPKGPDARTECPGPVESGPPGPGDPPPVGEEALEAEGHAVAGRVGARLVDQPVAAARQPGAGGVAVEPADEAGRAGRGEGDRR